ncbi:hypothetical protein AC579_1286 [Pseudocercospora musae]|uniref:Uncharacterized protein n=1 Tax=Pseudocercospora musae TaxID=113226 RepID=A0A139IHX9_9PEZI|nr:hypothetical protein AC579_1286 [Pseudocercospora musae]
MASLELMEFVVFDEDFVALASMLQTKIMVEYLRGNQPVVVESEDVLNDSGALLDKVGQRLGIGPAGLKDEWPVGFDVSNGWSMEDEISRHIVGVLMQREGVVGGHKIRMSPSPRNVPHRA